MQVRVGPGATGGEFSRWSPERWEKDGAEPAPTGIFVSDTFTGDAGLLSAHEGEVGATWTVDTSLGTLELDGAGGIVLASPYGTLFGYAQASGMATRRLYNGVDTDYTVTITVARGGSASSYTERAGIYARMQGVFPPALTLNEFYLAAVQIVSDLDELIVELSDAGSLSESVTLDLSDTLPLDGSLTLTLSVVGSAISVSVNDTALISVTNTSAPTGRMCGVYMDASDELGPTLSITDMTATAAS